MNAVSFATSLICWQSTSSVWGVEASSSIKTSVSIGVTSSAPAGQPTCTRRVGEERHATCNVAGHADAFIAGDSTSAPEAPRGTIGAKGIGPTGESR